MEQERQCMNADGPANGTGLLCLNCEERLWQEINWLADIYEPLADCLQRKRVIDGDESPRRGKGKGISQGLDLDDRVMEIRSAVRNLVKIGRLWILSRQGLDGSDLPYQPDQIPAMLRWIARNLHWIVRDQTGEDRLRAYAVSVVQTRQAAEKLVQPKDGEKPAYWYQIDGLSCGMKVGEGSGQKVCGGNVGVWVVGGRPTHTGFICEQNPGHVIPREQALRDARRRVSRAKEVGRLVEAILDT